MPVSASATPMSRIGPLSCGRQAHGSPTHLAISRQRPRGTTSTHETQQGGTRVSSGSQPGATPPAVPAALPPDSTVRFNVTDGSCRSAEWRVWTAKNADDVYAAARLTAGEIKISLHQSGSWQHGFTADGKAKDSLSPGQSRHFTIWQRPTEITPGWTRAVQIIIPDAALQARPSPGAPNKPVTDLLATHDGDTTIAEIWLESAANQTPLPLAV